MFEILDVCNSQFRDSYPQVAQRIVAHARDHRLTEIVELGAGTGPVARCLANDAAAADIGLTVCDLAPSTAGFDELALLYPGRIRAIRDSIDYGECRDWGSHALLVLIGTFSCSTKPKHRKLLQGITSSAEHGLIYEPVRCTWGSYLLSCASIVPGLLLPLMKWKTPGFGRRVFWCWLVPLAPICFVADGLRYIRNCRTAAEWRDVLTPLLPSTAMLKIEEGFNSQLVRW